MHNQFSINEIVFVKKAGWQNRWLGQIIYITEECNNPLKGYHVKLCDENITYRAICSELSKADQNEIFLYYLEK